MLLGAGLRALLAALIEPILLERLRDVSMNSAQDGSRARRKRRTMSCTVRPPRAGSIPTLASACARSSWSGRISRPSATLPSSFPKRHLHPLLCGRGDCRRRAAACTLPVSGLSFPSTGEVTMARIKLIHHINVQISDRVRTREWYEKVLGAEFLDRGPALNKRQLQLRLGNGEIHFTERPNPTTIGSAHFALEVDDWDAMLAHLATLGIKHVRTSAAG